MFQIDLTGRRVLLTGGNRGIGRAIALGLAQAGAQVALHYHHHHQAAQQTAEAMQAVGGPAPCLLLADLADPLAASQLFGRAVAALGNVDTLINNAGVAISSPLPQPEADWLANWQTTQAVNLQAPALLCRQAVQHWLATAQGGRIVNLSSRAAFRGDTADYLAYAASKGGLVALTRSLARAYGRQHIKAFNVAPGFVATDMAQAFFNQYGEETARREIALPQLTQPADIAPTVLLLVSGLADHATGCTIDLNAASYVH
jgi:3-oxoacyl-[acyl-carrier protein] reductase